MGDNIVFRLGMASSIPMARQLIGHKHILLNFSCVSIPSYQCKCGDLLMVKDSAASQQWVRRNVICPSLLNCPQHLSFKEETLTGVVLGVVSRESTGTHNKNSSSVNGTNSLRAQNSQ